MCQRKQSLTNNFALLLSFPCGTIAPDIMKKSSMLNNYTSSRGKGIQCTLTKSGASQNSPFNNCVLGHQVFEQERSKRDFVTIQMLLFLKSKLLCYHGNLILVFVTTLGHLEPHSKLKAWQLSTQL